MAARALVAGALLVALRVPARAASVNESESNGTPATADSLTATQFGVGAIGSVGDVDVWKRTGVSIFDLIFAYVDTQGSTDRDSVLDVILNDGTTVLESDNDSGPAESSVVAGAVASQAGNVFFRVTESGNDATINPYALYQAIVSPADVGSEIEGNDSATTATPVSARVMTGTVPAGDVDFFSFLVSGAPQRVVVIVDEDPDNDGIPTDTELRIFDEDGTTIVATGDDAPANRANAAGAFTAGHLGTYFVRIRNGGAAPDDDYRFVVLQEGASTFTNACCLPDGSSLDLLSSDCTKLQGVSQGPGSLAATAVCPEPTGACCRSGCFCEEISQSACKSAGGRFGGFSSTCATQSCGVTIFRDETDFAATSTLEALEDFEELPPGLASGCETPIPGSGFCFSAADIAPGLSFEEPPADDPPGMSGIGAGFHAFPGQLASDVICGGDTTPPTTRSPNLIVNVTNPGTRAVGTKVLSIAPHTIDVTVVGESDLTLAHLRVFTDSIHTAFLGVTSDVPLTKLVLTSPEAAGNVACIDDVQIRVLPDGATTTCVDPFLCDTVTISKGAPKFAAVPGVGLADDFETGSVDVKSLRQLCLPAEIGGTAVMDGVTHLTSYRIKPVKGAPKHQKRLGLAVTNELGTLSLDTQRPDVLLVPTAKDLTLTPPLPSGGIVDNFKCYTVKITKNTPKLAKGLQLTISDQFTSPPKVFDVKKPLRFCNAVDKNGEGILQPDAHLLCYQVGIARTTPKQPKHVKHLGVHLNNQLGPLEVDSVNEAEVCLPSTLPAP